MEVLRLLASADEELPLKDIAARMQLNVSTTHRLLATLVQMEFVQQGADRRYSTGPEAFVVGCGYLRRSELRSAAAPVLMSLAEQTKASSNLAFWHSHRVIVVDCIPMPGMHRFYSQPGNAAPTHATALGKCLLAFRGSEGLGQLGPLTRFTEKTICDSRSLQQEMASILQNGYAVCNEEYMTGCRCIAAPILQRRGEPAAAISVSGPLDVISEARIPELAALIRDRCLSISLRIGYRPQGEPARVTL